METQVLILGAGPAGLASAFELNKSDKSFLLVEKEASVGGLSKTITYGEFRADIGPHRFFSKNQYLYDFISGLLGRHWVKVNRLTRFHVRGKYLMYPVELRNALATIGVFGGIEILSDYFWQRIKGLFVKTEPRSFEEKAVADFGRSLAELNMLNYTEKIWGLPCTEISTDWATQRIKNLSLTEVFKKMLVKGKDSPKTLIDQFYYPDSGTGLIYESMKADVEGKHAGSVLLETQPVRLVHDGTKIQQVVLKKAGGEELEIIPEYVVSSIPITELVTLMEPAAPAEVLAAAEKLLFRSHVSLFLTLNKTTVFPDQWVYFPEKEIPFGRIMEPKNFSPDLAPAGKTSLLIEFFCWYDDAIWNADKEHLVEISLAYLEKIGLLKKEDIIASFTHKERCAYPVYDLNYKEHLGVVKDYFKKFAKLQLIGRAGSFRYNNQDHALEMGILSAANIVENKHYNIDDVGSEKEYFEKGQLK